MAYLAQDIESEKVDDEVISSGNDLRNQNNENIECVELDAEKIMGYSNEIANLSGHEAMDKEEAMNLSNELPDLNAAVTDNRTDQKQDSQINTVECNIRCPYTWCPYKSAHKNDIVIHIKSEHKIMNKICEECAFTHRGYVHRGRMFKCEHCPYASKKKFLIKNHIEEVHEKIKKHICKDCGFATSRSIRLKNHVKVVHEKVKKDACEDSDHATSDNYILKNQEESVHEIDEKQFKCEECGYAVRHKSNLRQHIKGVHEKIKNHVCQECGYAAS